MRAELFANATAKGFVAAFDMPPFKTPPQVVTWGVRTFVLSSGDSLCARHLADCAQMAAHDPDKPTPDPLTCGCGGAFPYDEAFAVALLDMHQIERGRDKPVTRKAE